MARREVLIENGRIPSVSQTTIPATLRGDIGEDKLSWELTPGPWYGACAVSHSLTLDSLQRCRRTYFGFNLRFRDIGSRPVVGSMGQTIWETTEASTGNIELKMTTEDMR